MNTISPIFKLWLWPSLRCRLATSTIFFPWKYLLMSQLQRSLWFLHSLRPCITTSQVMRTHRSTCGKRDIWTPSCCLPACTPSPCCSFLNSRRSVLDRQCLTLTYTEKTREEWDSESPEGLRWDLIPPDRRRFMWSASEELNPPRLHHTLFQPAALDERMWADFMQCVGHVQRREDLQKSWTLCEFMSDKGFCPSQQP